MKKKYFPLLLAAAIFMTGCSEKSSPDNAGAGPEVSIDFGFPDNPSGSQDMTLNSVQAYRIYGGTVSEALAPSGRGKDGSFIFTPTAMAGRMYVAANLAEASRLDDVEPGMPAEDFLAVKASVGEMTAEGTGMTGSVELDGAGGRTLHMKLARTVARLDISVLESGVKVLAVRLTGLAAEGTVFPDGAANGEKAEAQAENLFLDFSEKPIENTSEILAFLAEQYDSGIMVEVTVSADGGTSLMRTKLPENVLRNHIYTVSVRGKGAGMSLTVTYDGWETGEPAETYPRTKASVDVGTSVLPSGVTVNEGGDTVFVTHHAVEFELAVQAEPGADVVVDGSMDGVEISRMPAERGRLEPVARFSVSGERRVPGMPSGRIHLDFHDGNMNTGRIVILFEANPVILDGVIELGRDGVCDFGRYIDGELGTVTLPAGHRLYMEFPEGESVWAAAVPSETGENVYRILGGWRPNDPEADGREQTAYMVIADEAGTGEETYVLKRRNWGLPVVRIGETWWTLYNLRGDARRFEDQVTCADAPASGDGLMDLLLDMPEDRLLEIMGHQYQAGTFSGLPLSHDGTAFLYEGMKSAAPDFGSDDPSAMAPPGYAVPSYEDYAVFSANDNFNVGGIGSRSFTNSSGERIDVRIAEREVSFLGHDFGTVAFYEFTAGGQVWVLYGLGHQWNTVPGNIARMHLLLATSGSAGMSWAMEGYASDDRPGQNWMKFTAQNSTKTRMIRCVKTPVEYIY